MRMNRIDHLTKNKVIFWTKLIKQTTVLDTEIVYLLNQQFQTGPPQALDKKGKQFVHPSVHIPLPAIPRIVDTQITTAELVGHEKTLAEYYQKVIALAKEYELSTSAIRHYFWLRLWIWNSEAEAYLSFPWYDTLAEINPVLQALRSDREGTLFSDADQGWHVEIAADDRFFYFRQFRDTMEGDGTVLLKTEREDLQATAKALQERIHRQLKMLAANVGNAFPHNSSPLPE
jgi:hypothetical protein